MLKIAPTSTGLLFTSKFYSKYKNISKSEILTTLKSKCYFSGHRRLGRDDSHDYTDYDNYLFYEEESDSENDFPDCEEVIRTQI